MWLSGKESACQCRRHRRHGFNPWVGKIPWRRKWQFTPVFLLGEAWWATVHGSDMTELNTAVAGNRVVYSNPCNTRESM